MCLESISEELEFTNVLTFYEFANKHFIFELKSVIFNFLKNNISKSKDSDIFKDFTGNEDILDEMLNEISN